MGPLAGYFGLQPLPAVYFAWLACILAGYGLLTTLMKRYYIRRFGWQRENRPMPKVRFSIAQGACPLPTEIKP